MFIYRRAAKTRFVGMRYSRERVLHPVAQNHADDVLPGEQMRRDFVAVVIKQIGGLRFVRKRKRFAEQGGGDLRFVRSVVFRGSDERSANRSVYLHDKNMNVKISRDASLFSSDCIRYL